MSRGAGPILLGLDLGTTAFKCAAYDANGDLLASSTREYDLLTPAPGVVEADPTIYWAAFVAGMRALVSEPEVERDRISAIGISAQGETLIPVYGDGAPARNAIVWLDGRAVEEAAELAARFGPRHFYEVTGQTAMLPTWPAAKVLWLARHEEYVFERTARFLLIEDYFLWRLTGEYVAEGSLLTSTCYWDFRAKNWWPEMLTALGIDATRLPDIVEPGTVVGRLLPQIADTLGLPESTIVCAGALDQACGAIGVAAVGTGKFSENTGTAVALCAPLDEPRLDPDQIMPCHYHGVADTYMFHTFTSGGVVLRWFRDQFGESEVAVAAAMGDDPYSLLGCEAAAVAPGAESLLVIPHLEGAMAPESNPSARGAIIGLSLRHRRGHVVRAVLEAVAFVVRRNIEVLEGLDVAISEIRASGGGAKSDLWKQIEADVTQRPVLTMQQPDAATLGAAILAGVGTGMYSNAAEAADAMVHVDRTFEPNPKHLAVYDELYETYKQAYSALCPVFGRLAETRS